MNESSFEWFITVVKRSLLNNFKSACEAVLASGKIRIEINTICCPYDAEDSITEPFQIHFRPAKNEEKTGK